MAKTGRKLIPDHVASAEVRALGYEPRQVYPGKTISVWKMTCLECGHLWQSSLSNIRRGARCPHRTQRKLKKLASFGLAPLDKIPTDGHQYWHVGCVRCSRKMMVRVYNLKKGCSCVEDEWEAALAENELRDAGYLPKVPYPGNRRTPWPSVCASCGQDRRPNLWTIKTGKRCLHQTEEDKRRPPGTLAS